MPLDSDQFDRLCIEAEQLVLEGQRLYEECSQAYIKASPKAVQNPAEFRSQLQDLFRGLFLKIIHGVVLADHKLTSNELHLCRRIFASFLESTFYR